MTRFIIVADLRTGSTLLQTSLESHPQIRCYGELFHHDDLPDNGLDGHDRRHFNGRELVQRAFEIRGNRAVGFRAMVFLPNRLNPQWFDSWQYLSELPNLKVIYLNRKNHLARYASLRIAQGTGVYHPNPEDPILHPQNRPTVFISPEELHRWIDERERLFNLRRRQLQSQRSLYLEYEDLAHRWDETILDVQKFLDVPPLSIEQKKHKQEKRSLSDIIINYDELASLESSA